MSESMTERRVGCVPGYVFLANAAIPREIEAGFRKIEEIKRGVNEELCVRAARGREDGDDGRRASVRLSASDWRPAVWRADLFCPYCGRCNVMTQYERIPDRQGFRCGHCGGVFDVLTGGLVRAEQLELPLCEPGCAGAVRMDAEDGVNLPPPAA